MLIKTFLLILLIGSLNVSARPQQALDYQNQNLGSNDQVVAPPDALGVPTSPPIVSQLIVKIPGSPEASAAASAIAGHPVKVVKIIKRVLMPSATTMASPLNQEAIDLNRTSAQTSGTIDNQSAVGVATISNEPSSTTTTSTATYPVDTNTFAGSAGPSAITTVASTNDATFNPVGATQTTVATAAAGALEGVTNTIIGTGANNAISVTTSSAVDPNVDSPTVRGAVAGISSETNINVTSRSDTTDQLAIASASIGASNTASIGAIGGVTTAANPVADAGLTNTVSGIANTAATVASGDSVAVYPATGLKSGDSVAVYPATGLESGDSAAVYPATGLGSGASEVDSDLPSVSSMARDLLGAISGARSSSAAGNPAVTTAAGAANGDSRGALRDLVSGDEKGSSEGTTPKPKDGLAGFLDDIKKKIFGARDEEKGKDGDKEQTDGEDGESRSSGVGVLVAKEAQRLLDQSVHLAINSAGNFINKTAFKVAEFANAGIEQAALFATKLNNLQAELPAKAFEKLSQLDCNAHKETLSAVCPIPEAKKKDDSKKENVQKRHKKENNKNERKDSSRNELPELGPGENKLDDLHEPIKSSDDLIANKGEIQRVEAEKKLEVENLKEKLDSMKNGNSRASKPAFGMGTPEHPNAPLPSTTVKKFDDMDSTSRTTKKTGFTSGNPINGIHQQFPGSAKPREVAVVKSGERTGLNNGPIPRVQTVQTTTTAFRPPNSFDSFNDITKSIVPPAVSNFKNVDSQTVNAASG